MLISFYRGRQTSGPGATGLMMLKLAAAQLAGARAQQLSRELGGLVGECLGEDVIALGQCLARLLPKALGLLVLLATCDGELLIVDVAEISRGCQEQRADFLVSFGVGWRRRRAQLALWFGRGLRGLWCGFRFFSIGRRGCAPGRSTRCH